MGGLVFYVRDPPALRLYVLEALEVQDEAFWSFFDEHPLLGFLQAAALITVELILPVQHLHGTAQQHTTHVAHT